MQKTFLQTKIVGDWNRVTYSRKRLGSKRGETRVHVTFTPNTDANPIEVKSALDRAFRFFTERDGCLFGAIVDLHKLGTIEKKGIH